MHASSRAFMAALAGFFTVSTAPAAELKVVTTTTPLAALVRAVGGDAVQVRSIAHGAQDPHYVAAKPSLMRALRDADGLVYNGLQLEVGWLPLLLEGSRNPDPPARQLAPAQRLHRAHRPGGAHRRAEPRIRRHSPRGATHTSGSTRATLLRWPSASPRGWPP